MNYILRSLILDKCFMLLDLPFFEKLYFIFIKYKILLENYVFGFVVGKSYASIFGKKYYYDDKFGIAYLQSLYVDNSFLKKYIHPHSIVIDIGANIGQFNFFCQHYLNAAYVYSFEPISKSFSLLTKNTNGNIFPYAITTKKNEIFFIPTTSLMASKYQLGTLDKKEKIQGVSLDKFLKKLNIQDINLLKIDTEGSEYNVLQTSKNTLKKSRYLLLETSVERESSGDILDSVVFIKNILPTIKLIDMGRAFREKNKIVAIDLLFQNKNI